MMNPILSPDTQPVLESLLTRTYASAAEAAADICRALCEVLEVDIAYVTRIHARHVEVVAADDRHGLGRAAGLAAGSVMPPGASFCTRALAGTAPTWTADLAGSAHADVPARAALQVTTYAMVPLRDAAGRPAGTLCFLDRNPVERDVSKERLLNLLGSLLSREQEIERVRELEAEARHDLARRAADLAESEARYRSLVDEMRDIIVRVGADGSIEFVNRAWTELTGIPVEDVLGAACFEQVHPEDRLLAIQHLQSLAAGTDEAPREVRFLAADGDYRWMAVTGRAIRGGDGSILGFNGMLQDVTERRRAEEQIRDALSQAETARDEAHRALEDAQRASRAKSEFLSRMSHELRTPLNAILGFGQLLELSELEGEDGENVGLIINAGRHLLDLINEVLDLVRVESGNLNVSLEPVQVSEIVTESLDLVRPAAASRRVSLRAPAQRCTAVVLADRQRLKQVLVNLLSNAVKYNITDGDIVVDCAPLPAGGGPAHAADARYGWLRLTVTDTGAGIAAERLEDVFTPFERLGAETSGIEGTGIGLSLTKTLVEALGGRIGVSSDLGRGTTFWVDLPAGAPLSVPATPTPGTDDEASCTVLYVEDNPSNITLVRRVLGRRPHVRLVVAQDGISGLQAAERVQPDLVLLDLHLPGMSGDEVLNALRTAAHPALRSVPVAVVTADLTAGVEQRLVQAGADHFLPKPFDVRQLLDIVDQHAPCAQPPALAFAVPPQGPGPRGG